MDHIYLIGYMGCGKTTVAAALAEKLSRPFVDLDHYIESTEAMSIRDIFAARGENAFRELETAALQKISNDSPQVISVGGGTPLKPENMKLMKSTGTVIFLDAPLEVLLPRLGEEQDQRPLIQCLSLGALRNFIEKHLAERRPVYLQAHHHVDANLSPAEVVDRILKCFI